VSTLLLELAGPMQAWGSRSRFATRATELAPTKSGVIGLIAAALGMERTSSLERFDALRFGVRIDQPGRIERDFQTARTIDGTASMPLSNRYYLADAVFLVGLEADEAAQLKAFAAAVGRPMFPLFLGRRAFPPAGPIPTEVVELPLIDALRTAAWRARERHRRTLREQVTLELVLDAEPGTPKAESIRDVPRSFDPRRREYDWRDVRRDSVSISNPDAIPKSTPAEHAPLDIIPEQA